MAFGPTPGVYNTGVDRTIKLVNNLTGAAASFGGRLTEIEDDPEHERIKSEGIDYGGRVFNMVIPDGYSGTIMVDRANGNLEQIQSMIEQAYYSGAGQVTFTISSTTNNQADGSKDNWKYTNAVLVIKTGKWTKKSLVPITITFYASEKLPL